jgi:hypothetical protein
MPDGHTRQVSIQTEQRAMGKSAKQANGKL